MFAATKGVNVAPNPATTAYVGARTGTTSASLVFGATPLQQNDLVLVITGWEEGTNTPGPTTSGYTQAALVTDGDRKLYVGYKFMGSTPDTAVNVTASNYSASATNTIAYIWRGINTSSPLAGTTTTSTGNLVPVVAPAITFTGGAIVVMAVLINAGLTLATPSGMYNLVQQTVSPSGASSTVGVASAFDNANFPATTFRSFDGYNWCAATIALTYP